MKKAPNATVRTSGIAALPPLETATLHTQVYEALARALMAGDFRPGETLSYQRIADQFGVSPMPVRDAVRRLAAEGAVSIAPKRGVRIPPATASRLEDLTRVRLALEGLATELATERISDRSLDELARLADQMVRNAKAGKWSSYLEQNHDFHFTIYRAAGSELLDRLIGGLWLQNGPMMTFLNEPKLDDSLTFHHEIVASLRARDSDAARRSMEADIMDGADYMLEALKAEA